MIKFSNKEVFGIGLCPQDLRELRAGGSILLRVDGTDKELLLFIGRSDTQMLRDLQTEEVNPVRVDTNAIDNEWPEQDLRARQGRLVDGKEDKK